MGVKLWLIFIAVHPFPEFFLIFIKMNKAAWQFFLLELLLAPDWSETGIEDEISKLSNCLPPDYMFKIRPTTEPVYCRVEEVLENYVKNPEAVCSKNITAVKDILDMRTIVKKCNGSSNGDRMEGMNFVNLTEFRCLVLRAMDELTEPGDRRGESDKVDPNDACFTRDETWYQCDAKSMTPTQTNSILWQR